MTEDKLVQHRLKALEEIAAGYIEAQRRVDTLALSQTAIEKSIMGIDESLKASAASMARLHQRLDEITHTERFEQGREQGQRDASAKTWKVIAWTVMAVIAFMGVVVAALNLILG